MDGSHWSLLIGGFTFFFLGLRQARGSLQAIAGERLREILYSLTGNRITAALFGALVTVMLQSSGATSVMLISFAETKLLTLTQAIAILLGADIGTTFTVFLLSIEEITDYALTVVAIGFLMQLIRSSGRAKHLGGIILGFGLIFYGMQLMSNAALPLKEGPIASQILTFLAGAPLATLIISTLLAGLLHSAGTIGIAMALSFAGAITIEAAFPIVLGANIGSCITALLCGVNSGVEGRRVALVHTASKLVGVVAVFPFMPDILRFIDHLAARLIDVSQLLEPGLVGRIVIIHVLFNMALAVVFLPFINLLAWFARTMIPDQPVEERGPKYLKEAALETPALAFSQLKREIMHLASLVADQVDRSLRMFSRGLDAEEEISKVEEDDDDIDLIEKAIRFYLVKLSSSTLSEEEARRQLALLSIGQDLEEIGDIISKELVALARKKVQRHGLFSEEGWRDLRHFQGLVRENLEFGISVLAHSSEELVAKVVRHEVRMEQLEQEYRQTHFTRLKQGLKESFDTSSIHLDILSSLRRINTKITQFAVRSKEL